MKHTIVLLTLLNFISGCASVKIPNTEVCAVAGILDGGAFCAETLTGKQTDKTRDEFIKWLEPQEASDGVPARGAALCQSAEDWNKQKTAFEQACVLLGIKRCTKEIQQLFEQITFNVDAVQTRLQ